MSQVSLNTRISPLTDSMLRKQQDLTGKSIASMVDDAICLYILTVNKKMFDEHSNETT